MKGRLRFFGFDSAAPRSFGMRGGCRRRTHCREEQLRELKGDWAHIEESSLKETLILVAVAPKCSFCILSASAAADGEQEDVAWAREEAKLSRATALRLSGWQRESPSSPLLSPSSFSGEK